MYGAIFTTLSYKILVHNLQQTFHERYAVYCRMRLSRQIVDLFSIHVLSGIWKRDVRERNAKKVISHW